MRDVLWLKPAAKAFQSFPEEVRTKISSALRIAADGGMSDIAKPLKGLDAGVFEIAIPFRTNAYRAIYAVKIGDEIWVIHIFQKKSNQGVKTPLHEIELIRERLRRLKAALR